MNIPRILVAVFLILFSSTPLFALDDNEENDEAPSALWHINLDAEGNAITYLSLYVKKTQVDPTALKTSITTGLRDALQCAPEKVNFHSSENGVSYHAHCRLPASKRSLGLRALIKPAQMLQQISKTGAEEMEISLSVPRLGYESVIPKGKKYNTYDTKVRYEIDVKKEQKSVDDISVEFGYRTSAVIWELALLGCLLIGPVIFMLWFRKKTLLSADRDATAVWFGYWRVHRWIAEGIWPVWMIAVTTLRTTTLIDFVFKIDNAMIYVLIYLVPPACVSFLCQYLARPIWLRVRGIDFDRREMLVRGFWAHALCIAPLAFVMIGIMSFFEDSGNAMLWFAIALMTKLASTWMYGKVSRSMPRPLHGGELKERIMDLARQAGVKINQIYVMPAQRYLMGNAFAMRGGNVMITDYLLERLTKRETDCVMAHEIGHVKHRHTLLLSWFGFLIIFSVINVVLWIATKWLPALLMDYLKTDVSTFNEIISWAEAYLIYPISLLSAWLMRYFISRRCERTADEFATLVTSDPESMITSLTKLSKMNLMPIRWGSWDERLGTHPSVLRRSEAIAHRHKIIPERLHELLDVKLVEKNENCYTVPEEVSNPALIFSTEFKTQKAQVLGLLLMLSIAVSSLVTGSIIYVMELPPLAYLVGLIFTPIAYLLTVNYASLFGYGKLKREIRENIEKAGIGLNEKHVYFVGIVPEEYPRTYENHTVWDIGLLTIAEQAIVYYGEKIRFSVPRENISSIAKGPQYPSWFNVPEIYIRGANGDKMWVFHLHSLDGRSKTTNARRSKELLLALIDWRREKLPDVQAIPAGLQLNLPEFPDLKGNHPRRTLTVKSFVTALIYISLLAFGLTSLFRLEGFLAWYGLGISAWCLIVANVPILRYKEA